MRAAKAHGHAEALRRSEGDVGAKLARRHKQRQGEEIGRHGSQRTGLVERGDDRPEIANLAGGAWIRQKRAEHAVGLQIREGIANYDLESKAPGASLDDTDRLGVGVAVHEEHISRRFCNAPGHGHGFSGGGGLIEERRIGKIESGQVDGHLLKIQQSFEPALAHLGLVGRISRVPSGIFQDIA